MTEANDSAPSAIPYGYCQCGCGEKTNIAPRNRKAEHGAEWTKGEPKKFVYGHASRLRTANVENYSIEDCGYETPCWVWQGATMPTGYGVFMLNMVRHYVHRWLYEQSKGPIPEGYQLHHLCRVKPCCNPEHLTTATPSEHARESNKDRWGKAPETRASRGVALYRERGDEIVVYLDGTYGVPSRTEDGVVYCVELDAGTCTCPDHEYRDATCLHIVASELKRIKSPAPPHLAARVKPRRRQRCDSARFGRTAA